MPNQSPPPDPRLTRRRPTDTELDKAAEITEADVDEAVTAWKRYAPADARGILDAEPTDAD